MRKEGLYLISKTVILQLFCRNQRRRKIRVLVVVYKNLGIKNQKFDGMLRIKGIAVMDVAAVAKNQISRLDQIGLVIDTDTGGARAQINELQLFMPVSEKSYIFVGGMPDKKFES